MCKWLKGLLNEKSAEEIVDETYNHDGADKAIDVLIRKYSPNCDGNDEELWQNIKRVLQSRGVLPINIDKESMRMRNYTVTIREFNEPNGAEGEHKEQVLALNKRHACERAAEQFAMKHNSLDPKLWYILYEQCDD